MAKELKINTKNIVSVHAHQYDEPVSPMGEYFHSSALSVAILVVFELDVPVDDSPKLSTLENLFLPISSRFSSIMVKDENGIQQWKKVDIKLEDHVHTPTFPPEIESYDELISNYISKVAMENFPQNVPLWNLHIIKYPTNKSKGSLVFKLHHALGDGFSLMAALFSVLQRADDPSLPLTFPSSKSKLKLAKNGLFMNVFGNVLHGMSVCVNTFKDFGWSILKSNLLKDDESAVRSGNEGVELMPVEIACVEFALDDICKIKMKIGGTINDVITGIIFYGTQLYMQAAQKSLTKPTQVTALVLLNTRNIENYQPLSEMTKQDSKSPWGNQFGFIHVSLPLNFKHADEVDPLQFAKEARHIIKQKKNSLAVYITGRMLEILRRLIGAEGTAKYIHTTLSNTSMTISNLTGPMEKLLIAGHPVKSFHFMVVGVPQSLTITIVSYMGKLKVALGVEKGFIDLKLLISCMEQSFEKIYKAAMGKKV